MGLAWGVSFILTQYLFDFTHQDQTQKKISLKPLFVGAFLSAWLGAKIFFLLFSAGNQLKDYVVSDAFWLGGGLVFYGGLIFGLIFYLSYALIFKKIDLKISYLFIPGLAFGHAIGRIGCFLAGCCFGDVCDLPWKVWMHGRFIHPVQLYESIGLLLLGYLSLRAIKKEVAGYKIALGYFFSYALLRFVVEFFRGDLIRGIYWYEFSTSQLISLSIAFISLLTFTIIKIKKGT